tara:strand:+ start:625 stop:1740 length:1116 start_codon:yes stop_codon:yes gene_type:complete
MSIIELIKSNFLTIINKGVLGISFYNLILIIFLFFISLLIRNIFAKYVVSKIRKFIIQTTNQIDDKLLNSLNPPLKFFPFIIVFLIATLYIDIESSLGILFQKINNTLLTAFIFWFLHQLLSPFSILFFRMESLLSKALINWLIKTIKYLIIFLGIVAVLEIWGIKIGPIIAGLGLFGVAVALGSQDLFKNLISGIMIIMEKRFNIGDVINLPGHTEGTVEHIGFRSTLIRKFDSTPITIPNYIFAEAPILNYSNRTNRRINWLIGLEYNSSLEQIKIFTETIANYIKNSSDFIVNDNFKSFVRLDKFNDSSIDILVYCFTSTNDWEEFLRIKENLALKIKQEVEKIGLGFAFPSQSVYIENLNKEDISKI